MTYSLTDRAHIIVRDEDGAQIPVDPTNTDYQKYLKWLAEGNIPKPLPLEIHPSLKKEDNA